jgi:hypothetical protein
VEITALPTIVVVVQVVQVALVYTPKRNHRPVQVTFVNCATKQATGYLIVNNLSKNHLAVAIVLTIVINMVRHTVIELGLRHRVLCHRVLRHRVVHHHPVLNLVMLNVKIYMRTDVVTDVLTDVTIEAVPEAHPWGHRPCLRRSTVEVQLKYS